MELTEIINLIISIATLIGIVVGVLLFFRNPQISLEKEQAVNKANDKNKADKGDVDILTTKLELYIKNTENKFCDLSGRLDKNLEYNQNHLHTVDEKLGMIKEDISQVKLDLGSRITELSTIINERIPKK